MFLEKLERSPAAQVLDLGPVCQENIMYFAQRVRRLVVCDLFIRLNRARHKGFSTQLVREYLDYPPGSFNGINLWDLIDHLKDEELGRLVSLCQMLLKPGGMMTITSFEKQWAPAQIHTFVTDHDCRITFRLQGHLALPRYYHSNRIMTAALSDFRSVKSFIYRNGVREFLCESD
ncbi:MAG: class I SAM-dependent methyltransferase [Desulfobacterales bacterium]|nr:class I SAM-dependent methyltransferase [Desulfobacterales bacterium]